MTRRKVIISCAVTGAIHTPSMSPHLPITPEQITAEAVAAAKAGAAILHLHARDPETGKPDQTPAAFERFLSAINRQTDAVVNITSGGSPYMLVEERVRPAALAAARRHRAAIARGKFLPGVCAHRLRAAIADPIPTDQAGDREGRGSRGRLDPARQRGRGRIAVGIHAPSRRSAARCRCRSAPRP